MYFKSIVQSHLENMILVSVVSLWLVALESQLEEQKIAGCGFLIQKAASYLFSII